MVGSDEKNVNLMKSSFSYVVSKADQQFMGANSSGANVLYFKNLSADATVTLQLDNTFIATVGDDKVQVYVNVTQGQVIQQVRWFLNRSN